MACQFCKQSYSSNCIENVILKDTLRLEITELLYITILASYLSNYETSKEPIFDQQKKNIKYIKKLF